MRVLVPHSLPLFHSCDCREFNKSLIDYAPRGATPRPIDGIILTKFDTIDDKVCDAASDITADALCCKLTSLNTQVGASLSMVYQTGQPIVFVGNGQHYTNLHELNVNFVVGALLS